MAMLTTRTHSDDTTDEGWSAMHNALDAEAKRMYHLLRAMYTSSARAAAATKRLIACS
jgi:hypothetical protein